MLTLLRRAFRVHADTNAHTGLSANSLMLFKLRKAVENNMVADLHQLLHILLLKSRCKNMVLLAHLLMTEARFINAACRRACQIFTHQRIEAEHRKAFLCQQNMRTAFALHMLQKAQIIQQLSLINHIAGSRQRLQRRLLTLCAQILLQISQTGSTLSLVDNICRHYSFLGVRHLILP